MIRRSFTMADLKDKIAEMIQAAEEAAYRRGWDDAFAEMKQAVETVRRSGGMIEVTMPPPSPPPRRSGRPASATIGVVEQCINSAPGMKGVQVVKAAQLIDPSIQERTVRTSLRRLRDDKKIW
ncbi:MAG TPA: hypothetical protein VGJ08_04290, partial [Rhizomicrobium sp.]